MKCTTTKDYEIHHHRSGQLSRTKVCSVSQFLLSAALGIQDVFLEIRLAVPVLLNKPVQFLLFAFLKLQDIHHHLRQCHAWTSPKTHLTTPAGSETNTSTEDTAHAGWLWGWS